MKQGLLAVLLVAGSAVEAQRSPSEELEAHAGSSCHYIICSVMQNLNAARLVGSDDGRVEALRRDARILLGAAAVQRMLTLGETAGVAVAIADEHQAELTGSSMLDIATSDAEAMGTWNELVDRHAQTCSDASSAREQIVEQYSPGFLPDTP